MAKRADFAEPTAAISADPVVWGKPGPLRQRWNCEGKNNTQQYCAPIYRVRPVEIFLACATVESFRQLRFRRRCIDGFFIAIHSARQRRLGSLMLALRVIPKPSWGLSNASGAHEKLPRGKS